jgi:hypothetical protein
MTSLPQSADVRITSVWFEADALCVSLSDGRTLKVPLDWFPTLADARDEDRKNWVLIGEGHGIHWPAIDEDLALEGLLRGVRPPSQERYQRLRDALTSSEPSGA